MGLVLGVDTSSYTTSLCLLDANGDMVSEQRKILDVASGSRGLRQSEALFQHVRNLPTLTEQISSDLGGGNLVSIGVSSKPRPQEDSYMPVFLPGISLARSLSNILGIPCYELSHQENHIWAGLASAQGPKEFPFLAVHLSGGTTELTLVNRDPLSWNLQVQLLGGSSDLHAGQLVDRLGVKLGLPFPAGSHLEELALKTTNTVTIPSFHRSGEISFSGPLTALERLVGQENPETLARSCFLVISRTLIKWIQWAENITPCRQLLIVGGVAANSLIRQDLTASLPNWKLFFAKPEHSVDNAYGSAFYAGLASGLFTWK